MAALGAEDDANVLADEERLEMACATLKDGIGPEKRPLLE
jgi:hypothetical protein